MDDTQTFPPLFPPLNQAHFGLRKRLSGLLSSTALNLGSIPARPRSHGQRCRAAILHPAPRNHACGTELPAARRER